MMVPKTFLAIGLALLSACSPAVVDQSISSDHPAHPQAPQATYVGPPDLLGTEARSSGAPETQQVQPERPALPASAARHLTRVLKAYMEIGDLLAADTWQGTMEKAAEIDRAMAALVRITPPDDPHFWYRRDKQVQRIHQQAGAIGQAGQLKSARAAYAILSDALERLVNELGVPAAFNAPLYSFTCGMIEDAPRNGVWFQIGDDARNPYFGSTMIGCYRTEQELPTVQAMDRNHSDSQQDYHSNHEHGGAP